MNVRPTNMANAMLIAASRNVNHPAATKVIRHAMTDDPKHPLNTGYNRVIQDNIRVSQRTLNGLYKG